MDSVVRCFIRFILTLFAGKAIYMCKFSDYHRMGEFQSLFNSSDTRPRSLGGTHFESRDKSQS